MATDTPLPADDPALIAFQAYIKTKDYLNSKMWAVKDEFTEGSMWAAFHEGFVRGGNLRWQSDSDLLDACKLAMQRAEGLYVNYHTDPDVNVYRRAITKAEGGKISSIEIDLRPFELCEAAYTPRQLIEVAGNNPKHFYLVQLIGPEQCRLDDGATIGVQDGDKYICIYTGPTIAA